MKIDSPQFQAIFTPELKVLSNIFKKHSHELRIAGGAVRDILLSKTPEDLDFATTATPDIMKDMFNQENIRMINTNGESHGTITTRINGKVTFEITTLRIDRATDGRHAHVEFTNKWELDAERRDLTINAMYLGLDGTLYDYFNGYDDLKIRKINFVGNAMKRIQEDYLRILRYFRFHGRIADDCKSHNSDTLNIIKNNLHGLKNIAGERIWLELQKILMGNSADDLIEIMVSLGLAVHIGLPNQAKCEQFKSVYKQSQHLHPHPIILIASLLKSQAEFLEFHKRTRLSNFERDLGVFVIKNRQIDSSSKNTDSHFYKSLIVETPGTSDKVKIFACELLKYKGNEVVLNEIQDWEVPKFPISGHRLIEAGVQRGSSIKTILDGLKKKWVRSKFLLDEQQLLDYLPQLLNNCNDHEK